MQSIKCIICGQKITGRYNLDSWGQSAHSYHNIMLCFSCGRIIAKNELALNDGRKLCEHCQFSVISTKKQKDWIENKVRTILSSNGLLDIPQNITTEIVDAQRLMKIQGRKNIDTNQRGLAVCKKIIKNGITITEHNVFILDYLNKISFAGVLAHELLHVWQNEYDISPPKDICEGFCNLGAFAIYSEIDKPAARHYISQLTNCPDPVYGEGYRKVKRYFDKHGWPGVIEKIKKEKRITKL